MSKVKCTKCNDIPNTICTNRMRTHINGLRCPKCKLVKPKEDFNINNTREDGRAAYCKICEKESRKQYIGKYRKATDKGSSSTKYLDNTERGKYSRATLRRFYNYPNQCKRRGRNLAFDLTIEQFNSITSSVCHYCCQYSRNKNYTGIDRVDSDKDYTIENCVPCCDICNKMKSDYDLDYFISHISRIVENYVKNAKK